MVKWLWLIGDIRNGIFIYMKKTNILENIIKAVLFETTIKSVVKPVTKKQKMNAETKGAVFAYQVKVKGTSDPKQIYEEVYANTIGNPTVGRNSNFAAIAGKPYFYIMSDPLPKKHQTIIVWIVLDTGQLQIDPDNLPADVEGKTYSNITFGQAGSKLITRSNFDKQLQKANEIRKLRQQQIIQQNLDDLNSEEDIEDTNIGDQENNVTFKYPYEWKRENGKLTFMVYTLPETPKLIYVLAENNTVIFTANKQDFEQHYDDDDIMKYFTEITNPAEIQKIKTKLGL
jgi:hypothetical protein